MFIKVHDAYRKIIALADSDLIGKRFEQGIKQIEVKENFFKGEEKDYKKVLKMLKNFAKEDATFNIVGEESVNCAIEAGIINKQGVMKIDNIPVALGLF